MTNVIFFSLSISLSIFQTGQYLRDSAVSRAASSNSVMCMWLTTTAPQALEKQ